MCFFAGLLEENKRLRAEVEKAESVLSELQTPAETRNNTLRQHQTEVRHTLNHPSYVIEYLRMKPRESVEYAFPTTSYYAWQPATDKTKPRLPPWPPLGPSQRIIVAFALPKGR